MSRSSRGGPPAWLVFLVAVALVFGGYYVWLGISNYLRTGGLGIIEATERANVIETATAERVVAQPLRTVPPTFTPIPDCQPFFVSVPQAIMRDAPNTNAEIIQQLAQGSEICVIGRAEENDEWYIVDGNMDTRRIEFAYMHETIIRAADPTATPTRTFTPPPTITEVPSLTPSRTWTPSRTPTQAPTITVDPDVTPSATPTPTITPSPTITPTDVFRSA